MIDSRRLPIPSVNFALPVLLAVLPLSAASSVPRPAKSTSLLRPRNGCWAGPRQSTGVHDRIYHRVIALDDGRTQFFLVSSDLCLFSPEIYDEVASTLQQGGIERKQFWWSVTHTHSAPEVGPPGDIRSSSRDAPITSGTANTPRKSSHP